jgi:hypothetical protein
MNLMNYNQRVAAIRGDTNLDESTRSGLLRQAAEQEYGSNDFDINRFEQLLGRLESSKGRQQRQKSLEGRRDIYAQGLASMMSNF